MQIYIKLLDEAVPVWRPVDAEYVEGDQYRVLGQVPADEVWEFQPGDVVRCQPRSFADNKTGLAAFTTVQRDAYPPQWSGPLARIRSPRSLSVSVSQPMILAG
jgi:hypothetical protein